MVCVTTGKKLGSNHDTFLSVSQVVGESQSGASIFSGTGLLALIAGTQNSDLRIIRMKAKTLPFSARTISNCTFDYCLTHNRGYLGRSNKESYEIYASLSHEIMDNSFMKYNVLQQSNLSISQSIPENKIQNNYSVSSPVYILKIINLYTTLSDARYKGYFKIVVDNDIFFSNCHLLMMRNVTFFHNDKIGLSTQQARKYHF